MKKMILAGLLMGLLGIGILISGCQQGEDIPDILKILSVSPELDATNVSSTESLSVTFNFSIDTRGMTKENVCTDYCQLISGSHTAGTPEVTKLAWSNENRTMVLNVIGWSKLGQGGDNNRVAIRATNRIKDIYGNTLGSEPVLWRYRLRLHDKATEPTFVLASGSFEANSILVTIEAADADSIYYTDDGTDPTTSSNLYTAPISLESSKVIKALAVEAGKRNSDVASAWYDLYWWQALGSGFGAMDEVYAMAYDPDNDILYAGGRFTSAGGVPANNIAQWNGSAWSAVGGGVESTAEVDTLLYANGNLYMGGDFKTADSVTVNGIAKWDGSSWSNLGGGMASGVDEIIFDLDIDQLGNLVAGGDFTTEANYIAKWDGSSWSAFSTEPDNRVDNLAFDPANNILYASGWFTNIGTSEIAQWNGSAWSALGNGIYNSGIPPYDVPRDLDMLAVGNGNLYAGGKFDRAGTTAVSNIAMWNGTAWSGMGSGMNDYVTSLVYDPARNLLYAGGTFTSPGKFIARWDGTSWSSFGGTSNATLFLAAVMLDPEGSLYVVGDFTQIGGISANYIAKWGRK
jgi:hypothetical protein